jgi:DNA-binding MarR family transcriptional regulator
MQPLQSQEPIGFLVAVARRRLKGVVSARTRAFGLTAQEFWVLVSLLEQGGASLRDLAARIRVDPPAASRLVDSLARKGFVSMERDPADRRRLRLEARGPSLRRRAEILALAGEVRSAVGAGFSEREAAALRAGLRRVIENVDRLRSGKGAP